MLNSYETTLLGTRSWKSYAEIKGIVDHINGLNVNTKYLVYFECFMQVNLVYRFDIF